MRVHTSELLGSPEVNALYGCPLRVLSFHAPDGLPLLHFQSSPVETPLPEVRPIQLSLLGFSPYTTAFSALVPIDARSQPVRS